MNPEQCEGQITLKLSVVDETLRKLVRLNSEVAEKKIQDVDYALNGSLAKIKG